jgi:hypothetical protein
MFNDQDLFLTAEAHWAAKAVQGRVEAINASPNLHWVVLVEGATLTFDRAPTYAQIVQAGQNAGIVGDVVIRSITVGRKKRRRLVLMPWMRVRAPQSLGIAAE